MSTLLGSGAVPVGGNSPGFWSKARIIAASGFKRWLITWLPHRRGQVLQLILRRPHP